jgi:hypothetical protein
MTPGEIAELQKLLEGIASMQKPTPPPKPKAAPEPPAAEPEPLPEVALDDYNDLEAEEIIALLGVDGASRAGGAS